MKILEDTFSNVCREPEENILDSGLCIFHSGEYLKDPKNIEANKQNIKAKLTEKIEKSEAADMYWISSTRILIQTITF